MFPTCAMKNWILLTVCLFTLFTACHGNCTEPPSLQTAVLADQFINIKSFSVNAKVSYNCRNGYIRVPGTSNVIFCLNNSTWSTPQEFCTRRSCGYPGDAVNGKLHADDFLFGSRVNYTCNIGYNMQSRRDYRACQADGTWSNAVPVCSIQECPPPNAITDGRYDPQQSDYVYQNTVTYSCNQGLSLIGERLIYCTEFGNWSANSPQCKAISCSNPVVANGVKTSGFNGPYTLNSAVGFQCDQGFTMIGASIVVCNASSQWHPPLPTCQRVCISPPVLKYGQPEEEFTDQKFFNVGERVQYKCRPGFTPVSEDRTLTCLDDLKWSVPEIFCKPISCGQPEEIDHGKMLHENFNFGSTVNYTCNPGYTMISRINYRECQADGTWSGKTPVCKESVCDKILAFQQEIGECMDKENPYAWVKNLEMHYLYLQIENLKLDIELKKKQLGKS